MFSGFSDETIQFLLELRFHNNKAFMESHREEYKKAVEAPFFDLIEDLGPAMLEIDPEMEIRPRKVLSRIFRDTRFSRDKSPYRDHHWIAFRKSGRSKDGQPFFWFEFGPDRISWGCGIWGENREAMNAIRRIILREPETVAQAMASCEANSFRWGGETFRRFKVPSGVPSGLEALYRVKNFYIERVDPPYRWAFEPGLAGRLKEEDRALVPAWRLMTEAVREASEYIPDMSPAALPGASGQEEG